MADALRFSPSRREVSSMTSSESGLSPVLFTTPPKRMHYTKEGQLTPPSSPDKEPDPMNTESSFSSLSGRFRLTRFLTQSSRLPRPSEKANRKITPADFDFGEISNPVVVKIPNSQPNTLRISAEPCGPQSSGDAGNQDVSIPGPVPTLRRISSSHADLRAMAKSQSKLGFCNTRTPSYPASPLLPSPMINERRESVDSVQKQGHQRSYKSYDDLHILSYYQNANSGHRDTDETTDDMGTASSGSEGSMIGSDGHEFDTEESYTALCEDSPGSSESGWLANTMSYEQRAQRFTARCCQVVQQPWSDDQHLQDMESKIMMATVLVGPGKPKLVQIQRPPSSNGSPRGWLASHAAKHFSTALVLPHSPVTPVREPREISAFSPFDTPADDDDTDNNHGSIEERPATSPEASSMERGSSLFQVRASSNSESLNKFKLPQANQWSSRTTSRLPNCASPTPLNRLNEHNGIPDGNQKALCSFYPLLNAEELNTKLDMVISMIDKFPQKLPSLEDPLITALRSTNHHLRDPELLRGLAKVFPLAPRKLLSAIAAWQIVAEHFGKLEQNKTDKELLCLHEAPPIQSPSKKTPSITRLRRTLVKRPLNSLHQFSQFPSQHFRLPNWNSSPPLASSAAMVGRGKLQRSMSLHSDIVPAKARNILGIESIVSNTTNPASGDATLSGRLLSSKIFVVQKRIDVIARKLLQLVRDHYIVEGQREWDAKLWSAIGLVVGLVEGFDKTGLQDNRLDGVFDFDQNVFSQYDE